MGCVVYHICILSIVLLYCYISTPTKNPINSFQPTMQTLTVASPRPLYFPPLVLPVLLYL